VFKPAVSLLVQINKKKELESFRISFFVGDIIIGVGLGFLAKVIRPRAPTTRANFIFEFWV